MKLRTLRCLYPARLSALGLVLSLHSFALAQAEQKEPPAQSESSGEEPSQTEAEESEKGGEGTSLSGSSAPKSEEEAAPNDAKEGGEGGASEQPSSDESPAAEGREDPIEPKEKDPAPSEEESSVSTDKDEERDGAVGGEGSATAAPRPTAEANQEFVDADAADVDLMGLLAIDVSTATKTSESVDEAPAIITAVTASEIRRWGYQSVGEILQHIMGFYLVDDHITPNAAVRGVTGGLGAESGLIKVMIDGRSVAFRTTAGNWLGMELIPLSAIKQIEVIRGPASALYGADAFLGVINIITLDAEDVPKMDARVAAVSTGENVGGVFDVTGGAWGEKYDIMLTAAGESRDRSGLSMPTESPNPQVPGYNNQYGVAQGLERRSLVVGGRVGYVDPEKGHHLYASTYASGVRRGGDFAHWSQLTTGTDGQGNASGTVVSLGQVRVSLDGLYQATDELGLAVQSTYFQGGLLPRDRIEVGSDLFYVERELGYRGIDTNVEGRWIPSDRFNLIVGVETVYDNETLPSASRIAKADEGILDGAVATETVGLLNIGTYLSSNVQVVPRWLKLTGGARYDYHNRYGSQVSGRAGATSRLTDSLVLKALYGNAFKAPSPYLLFAEPLVPGDVIGNEDLKPQFIHTWEGQLSFRPTHYFSASSGVSYSIILNKAEFIPQGINLAAQNAASQQGVTWESRFDLRNGDVIGGYGSFEMVRSYRDSDLEGYQADLVGADMIAYPDWTGRAGVYVGLPTPHQLPLELATQAVVVGPRRAADASILQNGGSFDLSPYVLWNASLHTRAVKIIPFQETFLAVRVKNLLDARGPDPGFSGFEYPLTARETFLELRHRY